LGGEGLSGEFRRVACEKRVHPAAKIEAYDFITQTSLAEKKQTPF